MNILPKKKWHVRTKENMARVRRDEAKAAEEAADIAKRAKLADDEDRIRRLKAQKPVSEFDKATTSAITTYALIDGKPVAAQGHINFFSELEEQERNNLQQGNKEYEQQKKTEYNDWESKMGIMKRFAEDTKEYSKEKNWWETIPLNRNQVFDKAENKGHIASNITFKKSKIETRKKSHKRKRSRSTSRSPSHKHKKQTSIEKLRAERILREAEEKKRAEELLKPKKMAPKISDLEIERSRKYNTQFNPNLNIK